MLVILTVAIFVVNAIPSHNKNPNIDASIIVSLTKSIRYPKTSAIKNTAMLFTNIVLPSSFFPKNIGEYHTSLKNTPDSAATITAT